MLSADAISQYHTKGFLFPFQAFSRDTAKTYRADVERTCSGVSGKSKPGFPSYRVKPYLLFTWAANMVREPAILDAVEDLIGPDILVFHTTMWWKTKGSAERVPWHQDGTYFGLAPFEHLTAWVALSPSNHYRLRPYRTGITPGRTTATCRSSRSNPDAIPRPNRRCGPG
jgi:hypothetical protein